MIVNREFKKVYTHKIIEKKMRTWNDKSHKINNTNVDERFIIYQRKKCLINLLNECEDKARRKKKEDVKMSKY